MTFPLQLAGGLRNILAVETICKKFGCFFARVRVVCSDGLPERVSPPRGKNSGQSPFTDSEASLGLMETPANHIFVLFLLFYMEAAFLGPCPIVHAGIEFLAGFDTYANILMYRILT